MIIFTKIMIGVLTFIFFMVFNALILLLIQHKKCKKCQNYEFCFKEEEDK